MRVSPLQLNFFVSYGLPGKSMGCFVSPYGLSPMGPHDAFDFSGANTRCE